MSSRAEVQGPARAGTVQAPFHRDNATHPPSGRHSTIDLSPEAKKPSAAHTPATGSAVSHSSQSELPDYRSEYYTAAWGSPYARDISPSLLSRSARTAVSEQAYSDDYINSSPGPSFSLEHLIPSKVGQVSGAQDHVAAGDSRIGTVGEEDSEHTPRSRTQRWVNRPRSATARKVAWGGSSTTSEGEAGAAAAATTTEDDLSVRSDTSHHRTREENRTLDQHSFWDSLRHKQRESMDGLQASRWAVTPPATGALTPEERLAKALSPFHEKVFQLPSRAASEAPLDTATNAETPAVDEAIEEADEVSEVQPTVEDRAAEEEAEAPPSEPKPRLDTLRTRKRVSWRGRACIVSLPQIDYPAHGAATPLSSEEFEARLRDFEDAGYSTRGFDLEPDATSSEGLAHVRPIFPNEAELNTESTDRGAFRVLLPKLKLWAEYMDRLTEAKLAALGVSLGADVLSPSPGQDMQRQTASQYPSRPFSPLLTNGPSPSIGRPGMLRGHSHTMSMASPISPMNGPYGHMHRHSTFQGDFPGFMHGQRTRSGFTSPTAFSPQPAFAPGPLPGIGSPAQLAALRSGLTNSRGPGSPVGQQAVPPGADDYRRGLMEDQRRRQHAYSQSVQIPQPQMPAQKPFTQRQTPVQAAVPLLPEVPEGDDEEDVDLVKHDSSAVRSSAFNEDIVVPTPRGHRHNISEDLEREVLHAEHIRDFKPRASDRHHGQPSTNGLSSHAEEQSNSVRDSAETRSRAEPPKQEVRTHKKSASRFNVEAPVFNFNPGASFSASIGSAKLTSTQPAVRRTISGGHARQKSSVSFNAAAPAFTPANLHVLPTFEFSFANIKTSATSDPKPPPSTENTSIFGKVAIPDDIKAVRRSKAIPILKPRSPQSTASEGSEVEDAEGRIGRSIERSKRQRAIGGDDGDSVPLFAEPDDFNGPIDQPVAAPSMTSSPAAQPEDTTNDRPTAQSTKAIAAELQRSSLHDTSGEDKENEAPEQAIKLGAKSGHVPRSSISALTQPFVFHPSSPLKGTSPVAGVSYVPTASSDTLEDGEIRDDSSVADDKPISAAHDEVNSEMDSTPSLSEPLRPFQFPNGIGQTESPPASEPTYDEIDAVMRQMNESDSPSPDTRLSPGDYLPLRSPDLQPYSAVSYIPDWPRSEAPSPSPRRHTLPYQPPGDSSFTIHDRTDSDERPGRNSWPAVRRLNKADDVPASDWSDLVSSPEDDKVKQRSLFFDSHIDQVIGKVIERHLQPLELSLQTMQSAMLKRTRSSDQRPSLGLRSSSNIDSDADDEDEPSDNNKQRPVSRGTDTKRGQIKSAVLEALRDQSPRRSQSYHDIADLHSALADMKVSFARAASASLDLDDIRAVVEEVTSKLQSRSSTAVTKRTTSDLDVDAHDSSDEYDPLVNATAHEQQLLALEGEINERGIEVREAEARYAEKARLLGMAEEELRLLRESERDDESRIHALENERHELRRRAETAEHARERAETHLQSINNEGEAMQATLEEYRTSSTRWRQEIDDGKIVKQELLTNIADLETQLSETREENKLERDELEATVDNLERQLEENLDASTGMRRRLEKLHSDMATAAGQLVTQRTQWQEREATATSNAASLQLANTALQQDVDRRDAELLELKKRAVELDNVETSLGHLQGSHGSLSETVQALKTDLAQKDESNASLQRQLRDAVEEGRSESHRSRLDAETQLHEAKQHAVLERDELARELARTQAELQDARFTGEAAKSTHQSSFTAKEVAHTDAMSQAKSSHEAALAEVHRSHEATVRILAEEHERHLRHAVEDKQWTENMSIERLSLANAKLELYEDKMRHMEERLDIAKSAAAAAITAQARTPPATSAQLAAPQKVSAQALRESILVLQEQLQNRETRIDQLQNELKTGNAEMVKERDTEITWLRELLAVRNEDLSELITTLSSPDFNRDAVRDTAIRIRANLQMEQQEKDRIGNALNPAQAIASLSTFVAPKAAPLASAFSKWRASMESTSLKTRATSTQPSTSHTPSRPASAARVPPPALMNGLMTPPASGVRTSPGAEAVAALPSSRLSRPGLSHPKNTAVVPAPHDEELPTTPLGTPGLFGDHSYDTDAKDTPLRSPYGTEASQDDDLDVTDAEPPAFKSLADEFEPVSAGAEVEDDK
ncbi:hypothetical protein B0A48_07856 [Cryoendolithus antarcticus]|uniref:Uncharacterized protein n=1 Tax=Cryoendolithus antarcticus TaxID=1507870 RepID=A0A1V8T0K1_9PEZI|nr:hypothetical protein B0A48_07856 [Cryoendolithus antarcticus]